MFSVGGAYLRSALEVHARHGQRGDVHGDTAVQVQRSDDKEEPAPHYGPEGIRGMRGETRLLAVSVPTVIRKSV